MQKVVQYQVSSLKTHPHIIKCEIISYRLIQLVYHPKNIHSPHSKYQFRLKIQLPDDYPQRPPTVKFVDPIDHINISERTGQIFMPILREEWSSYISLYIIIDLIDTLLVQPQTDAQYCANYKNSKNSNKKVETFKLQGKFSLPAFQGNMKDRNFQKNIFSKNEQRPFQQNSSLSSLLQLSDQQKYKPIQAKKKKLLRMKTIILSKAEDLNKEYQENNETQKQQYLLKQTPSRAKIKQENKTSQQKLELKEFSTFQKNISSVNSKSIEKPSFIQRSNSRLDFQPKIRGFQSPQPKKQQKLSINQILEQNGSMRQSIPFEHIPTLKKNISEEMGSAMNKEMTTTVTLDRTTTNLDKISRTIKTFEHQYQNLINRRSKTTNSQLIKIIDCKIAEQIQMIKQLQQLSSTLKKQMISTLRQQVIKQK